MDTPSLRRGILLLALHAQFPLALTRPALDRQVGPFYAHDPVQLVRDLAYLEQKGFLVQKRARIGQHVIETATLTPAGVDVVEGTTSDPGIEIVRGG